METIKNFDKYLHFIGCIIILVLFGLINPIFGTLMVVIVARAKEVYDKKRPLKHTYDGWDAAASMASIPVGLLILDALKYYGIWQPLLTISYPR